VVYLCLLATVAMGTLIRDRRSALNVGAMALASSIFFFVVTNFSVWAFGHAYPKTFPGLESCYVAAIPFFRNSLAGDMAFTAVLFGGFLLLETFVTSIREQPNSLTA
jgi:hypothetical protein